MKDRRCPGGESNPAYDHQGEFLVGYVYAQVSPCAGRLFYGRRWPFVVAIEFLGVGRA